MRTTLLESTREINPPATTSQWPSSPFTWEGFRAIAATLTLTLLTACDKPSIDPPDPEGPAAKLIGKWADLSNAPETDPKVCCFFDSSREIPCAPDTLILRADSTMVFTSVIDEPSRFTVKGDTLYRFRGLDFEDTLRSGFSLSHDTLFFPITPLCSQNPPPARFRKVP
jgi:hypothetical protein